MGFSFIASIHVRCISARSQIALIYPGEVRRVLTLLTWLEHWAELEPLTYAYNHTKIATGSCGWNPLKCINSSSETHHMCKGCFNWCVGAFLWRLKFIVLDYALMPVQYTYKMFMWEFHIHTLCFSRTDLLFQLTLHGALRYVCWRGLCGHATGSFNV